MVPEREIWDPLRRKKVRLTPEEQVRQWFITVLEREMGVPRHMMGSEVALTHAGKSYRADIVVYGRSAQPLMIVECKRPEVALDQDVADQALRYNNELNVNYIAITNGTQTFLFQRKAEGWRALRQMPRWEEMAAPGPGDAAAADRPGARYLTAPIFRTVGETASELGVRAFVIGGFVRDCFLGRPNPDIDIVVEGSGIALAQAVAKRCGGAKVSVFRSFGTAMLRAGGMEVEFVGARKESYQRDSRKPTIFSMFSIWPDFTSASFLSASAFSWRTRWRMVRRWETQPPPTAAPTSSMICTMSIVFVFSRQSLRFGAGRQGWRRASLSCRRSRPA